MSFNLLEIVSQSVSESFWSFKLFLISVYDKTFKSLFFNFNVNVVADLF